MWTGEVRTKVWGRMCATASGRPLSSSQTTMQALAPPSLRIFVWRVVCGAARVTSETLSSLTFVDG
ncbi:hypothetical protein GCM10022214_38320 [Actinomadura miaoliensis]|uniref:Reverse transcriptase zinc-binding domain-containing protein n=1 Tax=Actinomadura miaoliensis TaxID=430685 RepID=A0ABP7VZ80_9ACTN